MNCRTLENQKRMKNCKTRLLFLLGVATFATLSVSAQTLYWDTNGITAGAGGTTPAGIWGVDAFWSTSSAGTVATGAWTPGGTAVFAAGTDASGVYTVTVNNTQSVGGITFEEGATSGAGVTLSGGTLDFTGGATISMLGANRLATISSVIAGSAGLTKTGVASTTLNLSGANTFTGNFTISGGDVFFNNDSAAGLSTIVVSPTASLSLRNSAGPRTLANNIVLNTGTGNITVQMNELNPMTLSGSISGNAIVRKGLTGTLTLSGDNSWTGGLDLRVGILALGHKNALGTGPLIITNQAGTILQAALGLTGANAVTNPITAGQDFTVGGSANLELSGSVGLGAATRTLTVTNTGSTLLSGVLSGSLGVGLTKTGNGTLTLAGANTYDGPTTVSAGKLLVNGSLANASAVSVSSGATLGGSGIVGNVNVASGGALAPGASTGIFTVGNLTLQAGSTLAAELNGLTAGSLYDRVVSLANVSLTNSILSVSLGFDPSLGNSFLIITNSGNTFGTFNGLDEGGQILGVVNTNTGGIFNFEISYLAGDGNDVRLTVVPEPAAWGIAALGAVMLVVVMQARRRPRLSPVRVRHERPRQQPGNRPIL